MSNYNGWTNYQTWRVALELFPENGEESPDSLRELADEWADGVASDLTARAMLNDYLSEVNWGEIAEVRGWVPDN